MLDILDRDGMTDCKPCTTTIDISAIVSTDGTNYHALVGALAFTRPDIAYIVQEVCLQMHGPCEPHLVSSSRYSMVHLILGCSFTLLRHLLWWLILTPIGPVVLIPAVPPLAMRCFWVLT